MTQLKVLVTGAAGFIGHHLVNYLVESGHWVRAVDWKPPDPSYHIYADEFDWQCDLRYYQAAAEAMHDVRHVYALAADMGGMGFISTNHWQILGNNARINVSTASAAANSPSVTRLFFASSACVYPVAIQTDVHAKGLKESDAWKGSPEDAYGVEKLMAEQMYLRMAEQTGIETRIARFHNIYGPEGEWVGGREKAPAAACRKVAESKLQGTSYVTVWGDGKQTRTFCYIQDCLDMIWALMHSGYRLPMNIGTDELVSIDTLYKMVMAIADHDVELAHDRSKPQGVRGRNADLTLMREQLNIGHEWSLHAGLQETYSWVEEQTTKNLKTPTEEVIEGLYRMGDHMWKDVEDMLDDE